MSRRARSSSGTDFLTYVVKIHSVYLHIGGHVALSSTGRHNANDKLNCENNTEPLSKNKFCDRYYGYQ